MKKPCIAIVSFPGNNCEVESIRAIKESEMKAAFIKWNDDPKKISEQKFDGYFLPGGFSYEDRGRSGMIAARQPIMDFLRDEAAKGKVIIGNCNGAQILVESGLIPLGKGLQMSLARNALMSGQNARMTGFLSRWIWIRRSCDAPRCATSNWEGVMHLPIAHGEGRFTTEDKDLIAELKRKRQIAFSYCDAEGNVSVDPDITPNGSMEAIAGICNPEGNVVALMPHPERTQSGKPYFDSVREWIAAGRGKPASMQKPAPKKHLIGQHASRGLEIFIDTIIVNNEERTLEQALHRLLPAAKLKQWKYRAEPEGDVRSILSDITFFNANKERAFIRRNGQLFQWNAEKKEERALPGHQTHNLFGGTALLRKELPEPAEETEHGICYVCSDADESALDRSDVQEIFANPHASSLERLH